MNFWDFTPPPDSDLGDHDVPLDGHHLVGKRLALLITGSIAAMKAPLIARSLRKQGADVVAFASPEALRYTTIDALEWSTTHPVITQLTAAAEHLSDSNPFHLYLVAPATYNTINKFRHGIADGVITSALASAKGRQERGKTQIMLAPTMHGSLHNSILTESLKTLAQMGVQIIPPREDYGKHNLPPEREIVVQVCRALSQSPLKGKKGLVTAGPTPVPIDSIRRLTNRFTGQLGIEITQELYFRGADVWLVHGRSSHLPPSYLPHQIVETYDDYFAAVMAQLQQNKQQFGIFSAAVADYRPEKVLLGKTPSGGELELHLVPTVKVIAEVRQKFADLYMITFKYQEQVSHERLMEIARARLQQGYQVIIANRGEEQGELGEQVAYLITSNQAPDKLVSKKSIAAAIATHLETVVF